MLFKKPGKCLFAVGMSLLFLFVPLCVQAWTQPLLGREVEEGLREALKENKEYTDAEAGYASIQKQLETLQEKLAARNPELKKLLEERKKLQNTVLSGEDVKKDSEKVRLHGDRLRAVIRKLDMEFSKSKEYAALSLRGYSMFMEKDLIEKRILFTSADKRVLKYNEALEKYLDASSAKLAMNLPKAKVEGSDEYKTAIYLAEKYREDPVGYSWVRWQLSSFLRQKTDQIARKEPVIRDLNRKNTLKWTEFVRRNFHLQEKNLELAWKVKIAREAVDSQKPETGKEFNRLNDELMKILRSDAEYAKLEKEAQELYQAYMKALDDFAAKSNAPEAVEYRKVKALLDEADKTASSGKAE